MCWLPLTYTLYKMGTDCAFFDCSTKTESVCKRYKFALSRSSKAYQTRLNRIWCTCSRVNQGCYSTNPECYSTNSSYQFSVLPCVACNGNVSHRDLPVSPQGGVHEEGVWGSGPCLFKGRRQNSNIQTTYKPQKVLCEVIYFSPNQHM